MQSEVLGESVHALPRVTLAGLAVVLTPNSKEWAECKSAYLSRFPEAQPMTELADFMFVQFGSAAPAMLPASVQHGLLTLLRSD